jgi:hypothetical protein
MFCGSSGAEYGSNKGIHNDRRTVHSYRIDGQCRKRQWRKGIASMLSTLVEVS